MNNNSKKIIIMLLTIIMMLVSFLLFFNDLMSYFMVTSAISLVLLLYLIYLVFKKNDDKSNYEREVKRILKSYDSKLVYSDENLKIGDEEIMFVNSLDDISKVSDGLGIPIIVIKEDKSIVFIVQEGLCDLVYVKKVNNNIKSDFEEKLQKIVKERKNKKSSKPVLDDIDKTTFIKLKNNRTYKVSPVRKK